MTSVPKSVLTAVTIVKLLWFYNVNLSSCIVLLIISSGLLLYRTSVMLLHLSSVLSDVVAVICVWLVEHSFTLGGGKEDEYN